MAKKVYYRDYLKARHALPESPNVDIHQLSSDDEPIQLGVNWAAIGTVPAEQARRFAADIIAAAEAVETFPYNGFIQDFLNPDATEPTTPLAEKDKPAGRQ